MCGICGYVGTQMKGGVYGDIQAMVDTLAHRGPDDTGFLSICGNDTKLHGEPVSLPLAGSHPNVGLGHTRLSIIDLSRAGRQPMSNEDGSLWIIYNGEIYNFRDIRRELQQKGHRFRSETDTEVVVHAYEEWGAACLDRFNGMFAFAIYDLRDRSLFLARDRLGVKPLYWSSRGGWFVFASEVKALVNTPWLEADWEGILSHLLFLWSPDPKTAFKGVEKLSPGHWLLWRDGNVTVRSYWDVPLDPDAEDAGEPAYLDQMDALIQKAVERRMVSDVPVGAFLSGGLDSSLITALMSRLSSEPIKTYTIAFDDRDKPFEAMPDDPYYARQVASHLETDHREILVRPEIAELLPRIIWHLEEPIADPAAINTYLICELAKEQGTTVMLSGMGADEIFAGYRKHLSVRLAGLYRHALPEFIREGVIRSALDRLPVASRNRGFRLARWAKRFAKSASLPDIACFIGNYTYYNAAEINDLLHPDLRVEWDRVYSIQRHYDHLACIQNRDLVSQMTYLDTKLFLPNLNLAYSDKASMAASVEVRVPFVDHEVVTFALNLPSRYRLRRLTQKYLVKKLAARYLPREVVYRPKAPFGAPLRAWMRRDLGPLVDDVLSEERVRKRGYFRYEVVRRMIEDNRNGRQDFGHRLWALLTIELWHRIFLDRDLDLAQFPRTDLVKDVRQPQKI